MAGSCWPGWRVGSRKWGGEGETGGWDGAGVGQALYHASIHPLITTIHPYTTTLNALPLV